MTRPGWGGQRQRAEQKATHQHRQRAQQIDNLTRQIDLRTARRQALDDGLELARAALAQRLGRPWIPEDPTGLLYDVLERVEVMPDGGWRWLGMTNNQGLASVKRPDRSEVSVRRFLAIAFGVIGPDDQVQLRGDMRSSRCGYVDVSPFRCTISKPLRDGKLLGNPRRFPTQQ